MKKLFLFSMFLGLVSNGLYSMQSNQASDPVFQGSILAGTDGGDDIDSATESYESDSENDPVDLSASDSELDDFIAVIYGEDDSSTEAEDGE